MILCEEIDAILSNAIVKEERGVAGHKYRDVVNEIVRYCQENIGPRKGIGAFFKNLSGKAGSYVIKVPEEITKKIDFVENVKLTITFDEMGSSVVTNSGGGNVNFIKAKDGGYFTKDGKLFAISINLEAFHHNGEILTRTFTNSLYHELNHAHDVWSRGVDFLRSYAKNVGVGYGVKDKMVFSPNDTINKFFREIFYRLFIPTELNALVSGVYGDLRGMNSERVNYREDIHNTQAAWILDNFTENFDNYLSQVSVDSLMKACKDMEIDDVSRQDPHTFLVTFKLSFEKKIREAWKRIGRAASLWYDDKEEAELNENGVKMV